MTICWEYSNRTHFELCIVYCVLCVCVSNAINSVKLKNLWMKRAGGERMNEWIWFWSLSNDTNEKLLHEKHSMMIILNAYTIANNEEEEEKTIYDTSCTRVKFQYIFAGLFFFFRCYSISSLFSSSLLFTLNSASKSRSIWLNVNCIYTIPWMAEPIK